MAGALVRKANAPAPPAPTAAPLIKRAADTDRPTNIRKLRLREELLLQRERDQPRLLDKEVVLGPFQAESPRDVEALQRKTGIDPHNLRSRRALNNARSWLEERNIVRRSDDASGFHPKRQTLAEERCYVGNGKLSCYPTADTRVEQGTWSKFIWNTRYPDFTNNGGYVDVYLFQQDTDSIVTTWTSLSNDEGRVSFMPDDSWWAGKQQADEFNGTTIDWPFYFVITYAGQGLDGTTNRQSTWAAVQTALPASISAARLSSSQSVLSALSSASAASASAASMTGTAAAALSSSEALASSSFAASLSSAVVASLTAQGFSGTQTLQASATTTLDNGHVISATATGQANGYLPGEGGDRPLLPPYAIALIAIFGFLALVAAIVGLYCLLAAARRRRERGYPSSHDAGSSAPMMTGVDGTQHPYSDAPSSPMSERGDVAGAAMSSTSRKMSASEDAPFSSNDASRMADAFRAALRKPTFFSGSDGENKPERRSTIMSDDGHSPGKDAANQLMREELQGEGHDLKTVEIRRKPEMID